MRGRVLLSVVGIAVVAGSIVIAQPAKENKPASGQPEMQLPEGMTMEDMQACMEAAMPGEMHAWLAEGVGEWDGKTTMWMFPGSEPVTSECTSTVTSMMDGRYIKCEIDGEMPGMGPFNGFGIYGFDNVSEEFQCTWVDNCGTGMSVGTGELSSDKKTLTWEFEYNCPMTKGKKTFREIERRTGKDSFVLEMWMSPPAGGDEYKMMEIKFTRKQGATATAPVGH